MTEIQTSVREAEAAPPMVVDMKADKKHPIFRNSLILKVFSDQFLDKDPTEDQRRQNGKLTTHVPRCRFAAALQLLERS